MSSMPWQGAIPKHLVEAHHELTLLLRVDARISPNPEWTTPFNPSERQLPIPDGSYTNILPDQFVRLIIASNDLVL